MTSETDSLVSFLIVGSVIGVVVLVLFCGILYCCRRGIYITSKEGRRKAELKRKAERLKRRAKERAEAVEEAPDDDDDDGVAEGAKGAMAAALAARDNDSDGSDYGHANFDQDLAELASRQLLVPKGAAVREPPASVARKGVVALPTRRVAMHETPSYTPPRIVWDEREQSFAYARGDEDDAVAADAAATRSPNAAHDSWREAPTTIGGASGSRRPPAAQPVGVFRGFDASFDPERALAVAPTRGKSRWSVVDL